MASLPMVVDSPPGMIKPSSPDRCAGRRTSAVCTPKRLSMARCSEKSPWMAKTPIFIVFTGRGARSGALVNTLPTTPGNLLGFGHLRNIASHHRLAQVLADLSQDGGILVMGHGLDNGGRPFGRVAGLEDAGADKHTIHAQLHHQGCIRRRGHSAGCEV